MFEIGRCFGAGVTRVSIEVLVVGEEWMKMQDDATHPAFPSQGSCLFGLEADILRDTVKDGEEARVCGVDKHFDPWLWNGEAGVPGSHGHAHSRRNAAPGIAKCTDQTTLTERVRHSDGQGVRGEATGC